MGVKHIRDVSLTAYDIKTYTLAELRELYDDPRWWHCANLPFSKARLGAYLENPHAAETDVIWLIAWRGDAIVAYLGLVPDRINSDTGIRKIAWFSSWWADPTVRGRGLAEQLTSMGLKLYPGIGIDSGTPWSMRKMRESGDFFLWSQRPRSLWMLNINRRALKDFGMKNALTDFLFPLAHSCLGFAIRLRLSLWLKRRGESDLSLEYLTAIDQEAMELLLRFRETELCVHDLDTIHWRASLLPKLAHLSGIDSSQSSYFGNSGFRVNSYLAKLWKGGKLIGLVNICLADGYLKIPFLYIEDNCERELSVLIARLCLEESIDVVYSQDRRVKTALERLKLPRWLLKSYPMDVLLSNSLINVPAEKILQDGDGAF